MEKARVISVIETERRIGDGSDANPVRLVRRYWTLNGELLAESDPAAPTWDTVEEKATALYLEARAAAMRGENPSSIISGDGREDRETASDQSR